MNDNEHLTHLMRRSVDDHEITTPDLLPRAKASRTRRRFGGVVGIAALVAAGALAVNSTLASTTNIAEPAEPSPKPTTAAETLSLETVTLRCQSQLSAYDSDPRWAFPSDWSADWKIAHTNQSYSVGDIVLFYTENHRIDERLCVVPAEGEAPTDIPVTAPSLADPDRVLGLCSQLLVDYVGEADPFDMLPPERDFNTPDLRDATIISSAELDGFVTALLLLGEHYYSCDVSHTRNSDIANGAREIAAPKAGDTFHGIELQYYLPGSGKTTPDGALPYVVGSGFAPVDGATKVTVNGDLTVDIVDGRYSVVSTTRPWASGATVQVFTDEAGNVLHTSTDGGDPYIVP